MPNQYLPGVIVIPSSLPITAITKSYPMIITIEVGFPTTEANTYIVGMAVRLFIPFTYKMFQANDLIGTILSINGLDFSLDLDSRLFDPFVIPSGNVEQPATISPNGSRNLEYSNLTNKVPFQSLNNRGN